MVNWKLVDETNGETTWVDPATIKKVNGRVYVTYLTNFAFPDVDFGGAHSMVIYSQVLCDEEKYDYLTMFAYQQPMGKGDYFYSEVDQEEIWEKSDYLPEFEFACAKY